jgi:multiple sugar transport system ATP-binding protein
MAEVTFEGVYKQFDDVTVINNLSFEIADQEFVVIVGPSGCGKSTSLRMIAGLESITEGSIKIGDRIVNDIPPKDRDIAMVFQNYALYPHMNVYRNMGFGLQLRKFPKEQIDQRVKRAADILGIGELLDRKPKQLSGGQRQRVAVGRAIVREPSVFLFDEPLSNLDAKLRVQMRSEIKKLHYKLKATMVYVTHDQVEAMTMGDRIVILKDGFLQQEGPPLEIYRHPVNLFVAGFIGSPAMNMLECRLETDNGAFSIGSNSLKIKVPSSIARKYDYNRTSDVIFGIRPEDLFVSESAVSGAFKGHLTGFVELVETTGAESLVHCSLEGSTLVAKLTSDIEVKKGQNITLYFDLTKTHLFAADSQESLWG